MDRFKGIVGYGIDEEVEPGIWEKQIVERKYFGTIGKNTQHITLNNDTVNGGVRVVNTFTIVGDSYAFKHSEDILYLIWKNRKWTIEMVDLGLYPEIQITLGGEYHGPQTNSAEYLGEDTGY